MAGPSITNIPLQGYSRNSDVVSIYSGCDTVNKASVDIAGVIHRLELVKVLVVQRIGKGFSLVILFLTSPDIGSTGL